MPSFNKIILMGNLTRDPSMKTLPSGTDVVEFCVAVNRKYKDKDETVFFDCELFGKGAATFNQYMKKGRATMIEGRVRQESWEGKDGQKKTRMKVVVENFQFIGGKESDNGSQAAGDDLPF
jgi:single-strand DNA-binding protein